jgi:N-acyl homoserine lactone hydrolase
MAASITPLLMGDYLAPDGPRAGSRILIVAYLIRAPEVNLLFDTGFPWDGPTVHSDAKDEIETFPRSLAVALESAGSSLDEVDLVANCHLHPDHGGGNFRVAAKPIYIQRAEFENARNPEQAIDWSVVLDTANYQVIEGEREIVPGVSLVATPGHTPGHQSLIVDTKDGNVVLIGQAVPSASDYALLAYHAQLEREGDSRHPQIPEWYSRIEQAEPMEVRFAHDLAVWRPDRVN